MKRVLLVSPLFLLIVAPASSAQMASTRFINFVDTPATVTYNQYGEAVVRLDAQGGSSIDVSGFRKLSVRIGSTRATSFRIAMGKISNTTLAYPFDLPRNQRINTFDVVGPEMSLWLRGGPPNTTETVQLWLYLSS